MQMQNAEAVSEYAPAAAKVLVAVRARFAPDIRIAGAAYCFVYRITIRNIGAAAFRLMSREWKISDGDGGVREVRGAGVVGEQPRIIPGEEFVYESFVDMPTPAGCMSGAYTMRLDDGEEFQAAIPQFSLAAPGKVH